jgi:hypothetical protein
MIFRFIQFTVPGAASAARHPQNCRILADPSNACTLSGLQRVGEVDAILSGRDARSEFGRMCSIMPTVFVIGEDWTLRSLVRAELREHGVEALGMETPEEAARAAAAGTVPSAVVLDATSLGGEPAALPFLARSVPVLVVTSPGAPAPAWAAAVLRRPVRVGEIVAGVENLLKGLAA